MRDREGERERETERDREREVVSYSTCLTFEHFEDDLGCVYPVGIFPVLHLGREDGGGAG